MDEKELRRLMYTASLPDKGCFVIRYPRGRGIYTEWKCPLETIEVGTGRKINDGEDVAVLTLGPIGNDVQDVIATMNKKPAHYDMRFLKPLDENLLKEVAEKYKHIITIEDGVRNGGMGTAVMEWLNDNGYTNLSVKRMGIPDKFIEHGSIDELRAIIGLDNDTIKKTICSYM